MPSKSVSKSANKENKQYFSKVDKSLEILEVQNYLPELPLPRPIDDRLPCVPGITTFIARCRSGKSNMICNFLLRPEFYEDIFDIIYYISPTVKIDRACQIYFKEEIKDKFVIFDDVKNVDAIMRNIIEYQMEFDVFDPSNLPPRILVVLDDISGYLKRNGFVTHCYSRYRHFNMTIWTSNQTCKDLPCIVRSMSTAVFLSKCSSTIERKKILDEWSQYLSGEDFMNKIWDEATDEQYSWLYIKLDEVKPRAFKIGPEGIKEYKVPEISNYKELRDKKISDASEKDGL